MKEAGMSFLKKVTSACTDLVTARRTIWDTFDSCRTVRVAVIGGRDCGKTVFLSALANHLRHHWRSEFSLGGGTLQVHWKPVLLLFLHKQELKRKDLHSLCC